MIHPMQVGSGPGDFDAPDSLCEEPAEVDRETDGDFPVTVLRGFTGHLLNVAEDLALATGRNRGCAIYHPESCHARQSGIVRARKMDDAASQLRDSIRELARFLREYEEESAYDLTDAGRVALRVEAGGAL